jgi:apolipoprotein N-acyltransferase
MAMLAAAATGVLYFLGFTGFGYWPLIFVFQVPLFVAIEGRRRVGPWTALGLGEIAGIVAYMGGYYWLVHLLRLFAKLDLPYALLGFFLVVAYKGGTVAVEGWLYQRFRTRGWHPALSGAVAMVAVEATYPLLFPNFAANALFRVPIFTQPVELFGMAALGVLLGGVNGAWAGAVTAAWQGDRRTALRRVGIGFGIMAAFVVYGAIRIPMVEAETKRAPTLRVAMVQANLGAENVDVPRSEFSRRHQIMTHAALREHDDIDLVVWPESGYGRALRRSDRDLTRVSRGAPVQLLFGANTVAFHDQGRSIYNSAILTSTTGQLADRFDKIELLMFGETLPLVDTIPQLKAWFPQSGRFTRGAAYEPIELQDGTSLLPMICYEDIIPAFVRRMWTRGGPAALLVNLTNDSWYGDTHEPTTHLALATFRTLETRRAMVRSTNTGISAIVDPTGRIVARTGQRTRETLVFDVPIFPDGGSTPFMRWGNVLGWLGVAMAVIGAWPRRRRA